MPFVDSDWVAASATGASLPTSDELIDDIVEKGTLHHREDVPEDIRRVFVTAHDVSPEWHIRMQAAFQDHVDNAVSKTVNFPAAATVDAVREIFLTAFARGVKGISPMLTGPMGAFTESSTAFWMRSKSMFMRRRTLAATPSPSRMTPSRRCSVPM